MNYINKYILIIISVVLILCASNINWGGDKWKNIILSDGKGYYAYLPALFIYHDLNLGFYDEVEQAYYYKNTFYDYRASDKQGNVIDKYFSGTALLMLPFFLLAHLLSIIAGLPTDGYSKFYPILINLAAIFYLIAGLYYLKKILQGVALRFSKTKGLLVEESKAHQQIITIVLIAFVFGTNLFYYAIVEPAVSHVYSFFSITALIYSFKKLTLSHERNYLLLFALFLGITILIRPVNVLVLFALPFICENYRQMTTLLSFLVKNIYLTIFSILIVLGVIAIQFIIYKLQTGQFFIDAYSYEHFNWLKPEFLNILFSYKKGLFVYTPLLFISLAGLIPLFQQNRYQFFAFIAFFILLTYVLSSWWCWYYGGSFGLRAYVEFYALFAILLTTMLLNFKNTILKKFYYAAILIALIVCVLQTYQYRYYQIHWSEMTKEKYWEVFLRIDQL